MQQFPSRCTWDATATDCVSPQHLWPTLTGPADMNDSHSKHILGSSWDPCWKSVCWHNIGHHITPQNTNWFLHRCVAISHKGALQHCLGGLPHRSDQHSHSPRTATQFIDPPSHLSLSLSQMIWPAPYRETTSHRMGIFLSLCCQTQIHT